MVSIYKEHRKNQYETMNEVRQGQKNLLDTFMADIAKHSGKINVQQINRICRAMKGKNKLEDGDKTQ